MWTVPHSVAGRRHGFWLWGNLARCESKATVGTKMGWHVPARSVLLVPACMTCMFYPDSTTAGHGMCLAMLGIGYTVLKYPSLLGTAQQLIGITVCYSSIRGGLLSSAGTNYNNQPAVGMAPESEAPGSSRAAGFLAGNNALGQKLTGKMALQPMEMDGESGPNLTSSQRYVFKLCAVFLLAWLLLCVPLGIHQEHKACSCSLAVL